MPQSLIPSPQPQTEGLDPQRLTQINDSLMRYVDDGKLPGFVSLVARHGKVVYTNTCGYMDIETQKPMAMDTIFRIYSMTKPLTSVALLRLYEQGLFNLHDPLSDYLPEFKDVRVYEEGELVKPERPISIQHILTHTAGFCYGSFGDPENASPVDLMYDDANLFDRNETLDTLTKRIASLPLRFHPGTRWHYSMATDVCGRLVEVLSGQLLADYIEQTICQPLGMVDTGFTIEPAKLDRFATLYNVTDDDPLAVLDHPSTSSYLPPIASHSGGGGMISTIGDYYRFAQCLLNGGMLEGTRILGRKTVERMRMNHLPPELMPISFEFSDPYYGLGFGLGVSPMLDISRAGIMGSNGDHGWGGYAETVFWIDPQEDLIAINMTQCIPSGHYPVRLDFRTAVYQSLL